eukprot:gene6900-14008_t
MCFSIGTARLRISHSPRISPRIQVQPFNNIEGLEVPEELQKLSDDQLNKLPDDVDYVVIGSGIGGLSCAALLGFYGYSVVVLESHYLPGGVAHTFERKGFKFDAGPSLWNGMATPPYNPLRQILEIVGEGDTVKYNQYDGWIMHTPECSFKFTVGENKFEEILKKYGGPNALSEWKQINKVLEPVTELSVAVPPLTLRSDAGVLLTLLPHLWKLMKGAPAASQVEGSFKAISKTHHCSSRRLHNERSASGWRCAGLPYWRKWCSGGRPCTWCDENRTWTGIQTEGYSLSVLLNTHVESITVEGGRATGVILRKKGKRIRAKRAVISNASIWDTMKLLSKNQEQNQNQDQVSAEYIQKNLDTPMTGSFVHLHIGINATGLPLDLESHYTVINQWEKIDAPQNHVIISIPSTLDPNLAPPGCHVIHAYAAANEPFDLWEKDMSRDEYLKLKDERCDFLWKAIERSIPDVRSRVIVNMQGSPLTHMRFNRRYKGTFGPAWRAGKEKFPYPKTDIDGLLCCGDSIFPGIGVPAVAVSGANAASSTVSVKLKILALFQCCRNH